MDPPIRIAKGRLPVGPLSEPDAGASIHRSFGETYQHTKQLEGEILEFTLQTQSAPLDAAQSARIDRCQRAVREGVHSSKNLKDIHADLANFELADAPILISYGQRLRDALTEFYLSLFSLRESEKDALTLEDIIALNQLAHRGHDEIHRTIYEDIRRDRLDQADISSLLNANREMLTSCRSLTAAIAAYELRTEQLEALETLPESVL